jgi:hypothetical protein
MTLDAGMRASASSPRGTSGAEARMGKREVVMFAYLRYVAAIGGVLALLLTTAPAAGADTRVGHWGQTARHHLRDTARNPGARCLYQDGAGGGDEDLYMIRVRPPVVYARNESAGTDRQLVGRTIIVQVKIPGFGWINDKVSAEDYQWATDRRPAPFTVTDIGVTPRYGAKFRIRITMTWYGTAAAGYPTLGQATNEVDWYKKIYRSSEFGDDIAILAQRCPDYYPG